MCKHKSVCNKCGPTWEQLQIKELKDKILKAAKILRANKDDCSNEFTLHYAINEALGILTGK